MKTQFFTDFDGTITQEDTLVLLLDRFGKRLPDGSDWRSIEFNPALSEVEKLQAELDLLTCDFDEAMTFLRSKVRIRQGFKELMLRLAEEGIPVQVLSGGLLPILKQSLAPLDLPELFLGANELSFRGNSWRVVPPETPRIKELCNHCKSWFLRESEASTKIYVGDGSTDFCPAERADIVYARGSLLKHCQVKGLPHEAFDTFDDIYTSMISRGLLPQPLESRTR
jgi:2-hydroxy-3-keto-5-methylthiopentenyl-1-phosphate phosphatase